MLSWQALPMDWLTLSVFCLLFFKNWTYSEEPASSTGNSKMPGDANEHSNTLMLSNFLWENIWSIDKNDIINLNFYNTCAKIIITSCPSFQLSTGSMESKYFDASASWKQSFWKCVTNPFLQFSCWQPIFNSPVANKLVQCHYYKKFLVQNDLNAKCILCKML